VAARGPGTSIEIMATYSREDFEQIASAIDKDVADVCRHERQFEAAAMWYRLDRKAPKRQTDTFREAQTNDTDRQRCKQAASISRS
jgi:hypothetical protein